MASSISTATRTVRVPVNAPSAASAAEAVRDYLTREGRPFLSVEASSRAGASKPDSEAAIVVTKPAGSRITFIVFVTVPGRTTRDLCQTCWQDAHPTEYCPELARYGTCSECGDPATLITRSRIADEAR